MGAHGHAASHMNHNQAQTFIGLSNFLRIALRNSFLIQGMENTYPGKLRHAGISGNRYQFIHHCGIYNVGRHANGVRNFLSQNASQIRSMLPLNALFQVPEQIFRHGICTAGNGLEHSAPSHHNI